MFQPTLDRLLVTRCKHARRVGSFFLADNSVPVSQECIVRAVGPGLYDKKGKRKPMSVAVGDRILIDKWDFTDVKVDGKDCLIVEESKVIGKVIKEGEGWRLKPLKGRLVATVIKDPAASLIVMPDLATPPSVKAEILAVADDVDAMPGEVVHFAENYGTRVDVGGENLVILSVENPLAIESVAA